MKRLSNALSHLLRRRFDDTQRFVILCALTGLLCGLAAVLFHEMIRISFQFIWNFAETQGRFFHLILFLAPGIGGLIVGLLLHWTKMPAGGSGIPQTKLAYHNDAGRISFKEGVWRFFLGVISIGSGNSLGREGPTVHFCAAIASSLGRIFKLAKTRVQALVPVGMGAGIAAAFNTPLSAITFVFEELLQDFSTKALSGLVLAVVIAATVSRLILGEDPVLSIDLIHGFPTAGWMLVAIPLGLSAGFLGHFFVQSLLYLRGKAKAWSLPDYLKPALAGLGTGLLGLTAWELTMESGVFSIGYESLRHAFSGQLGSLSLFILFVLKMVAVLLCYSLGSSGGLFSPTLFLGGMLGGLFGMGLIYFGIGSITLDNSIESVAPACVLLGMGAMFASVIRCPFTSLLVIFEMTRNYGLILPLMGGNIIAYYIAAHLREVPLYDALIAQDGNKLRHSVAYQDFRDAYNLPVSAIMGYTVEKVFGSLPPADVLGRIQATHKAYPVVDADDCLIGLVAHEELERLAKANAQLPLQQLLSFSKASTALPEDTLRSASSKMVKENLDRLVVVDHPSSGKIIGVITLHDIARQQEALSQRISR